MKDQQYKLKSYVLFFKSEGNKFQYKLVSVEKENSFKGSLLESLLSDKERFSEGGNNFDSKNAYNVRLVVHSHEDFSIGQVSKADDVATFAQEFFLPEEKKDEEKKDKEKKDKEYMPTVHITLDDSYVYNLYNLSGSIYTDGRFYEKERLYTGGNRVEEDKLTKLREKLPSQISRSYQILDSSIWNKIVPYNSFARRIVDNTGTHDEHIAGGPKGLFNTIAEIETNYKRGLYGLGVAKEYANLNARLTLQAFLSGSHASGVSPFIFHSESATVKMINDEFNNKNVDNKPIIDKIKERRWRILLVDDKAHLQMDFGGENTPKAEDGLYNNCKLRIIKNLFEDQFEKAKIEWRSCKRGLKDPALYIWFKGESCREAKEQIIQLFEKDANGKKINFIKECLHEIVLQNSQENNTSQDGNMNCETSNRFYELLKSLKWMMKSLFVKKEKEDSSKEIKKNEARTMEKESLLGYKYVGEDLQEIKDIIDTELNNIFKTKIEKEIDHKASFLIEYAETLDEAEKALQTKKYDFILLDYLLNNEYGYELLDRIYCYTEAKRIFDEADWDKLTDEITCDNPSGEYDEFSRYFSLKKEEIEKLEKLIQVYSDNPDDELRKAGEDAETKKNLIEKLLNNKGELKKNKNLLRQLLKLDKYKFGPHRKFFFMFISAYTSAVYERLLAEGLNRNEKYWYIAVGACPTNTPNLFMYNLLKLMEKQLVDSGIDEMTPEMIYKVVNKIYGGGTNEVRKNANKYYQDVLNLQYLYKKMLADVDIPREGGIFNTKGSVLITDFIMGNVNLGGFLEHLTQLVHLTAFGTVRQWPEIWEEYIYFKSQFNIEKFKDKEKFNKLCVAIEKYVIDLKEDVQ